MLVATIITAAVVIATVIGYYRAMADYRRIIRNLDAARKPPCRKPQSVKRAAPPPLAARPYYGWN